MVSEKARTLESPMDVEVFIGLNSLINDDSLFIQNLPNAKHNRPMLARESTFPLEDFCQVMSGKLGGNQPVKEQVNNFLKEQRQRLKNGSIGQEEFARTRMIMDALIGKSILRDFFDTIHDWSAQHITPRRYEKSMQARDEFISHRTTQLDLESTSLLEGTVNQPEVTVKHLKKKLRFDKKWQQVVILGAVGLAVGTGLTNYRTQERAAEAQIKDMITASNFALEWRMNSSPTELVPNITSTTAESPQEPQGESEHRDIPHALEVLREVYDQVILPSRLKHAETLPLEERKRLFEAIGGPENLDNGKMVFANLGKDSRPELFGFDRDGKPLGHNDQNLITVIDLNNNEIEVITLTRDISIPPGMYGANTPATLNGLTWVDQTILAETGEIVTLDRKVAQLVFTEATGIYVDGINEFDFISAARIVDALFPEGISVNMQDTFIPDVPLLAEVAGYDSTGAMLSFQQGQSYTFSGEALVELLRSRSTRAEGAYSRESDAARVMSDILKQMKDQLFEVQDVGDIPGKLMSLNSLRVVIQKLQDEGHLSTHYWGENKIPTDVFMLFMGAISANDISNAIVSYSAHSEGFMPEFRTIATDPSEILIAPWDPGKSTLPSGIDPNNPNMAQQNPLLYWESMRTKLLDTNGE